LSLSLYFFFRELFFSSARSMGTPLLSILLRPHLLLTCVFFPSFLDPLKVHFCGYVSSRNSVDQADVFPNSFWLNFPSSFILCCLSPFFYLHHSGGAFLHFQRALRFPLFSFVAFRPSPVPFFSCIVVYGILFVVIDSLLCVYGNMSFLPQRLTSFSV